MTNGGSIRRSTSQETRSFFEVILRIGLLSCWLWAGALAGIGAPEKAAPGPALPRSAPARVVIVEDPGAMVTYSPALSVLKHMVTRGLTNLTGKPTGPAAWLSLVSTQDVVGLKVFSAPGAGGGTRLVVVEAIVQGLLDAGLPPKQIVVWDKQATQLRLAGFEALADRSGIRVQSSQAAGYDTNHFYESPLLSHLVWGDHEFGVKTEGAGRKSYVSKLVTQELTKLINVTPLLNHNLLGVSGNLYSLALGSADNTLRFAHDSERLATAVPEIFALPVLGDRVVLNVVDALAAQYLGEERSLLHYSGILNQLWFSADPVALDVLSIQELNRQREAAGAPALKTSLQLYHNAALLQLGVADLDRVLVERTK
jgi:hypothetical protein